MHNYQLHTGESAESRLFLSLMELCSRVAICRDPKDRARLRATIDVLRQELVKLIENLPVPTEAEIEEALKIQSGLYSRVPLPPC
ncbi:MAG TPA: hypothetical protein PKI03_32520 [Pseudomonadota bacterium]|nr:hypothetical protein [Pseudomonadota bacterium]